MRKGWEYKKLGEVCDVINGLWIGKKEPFINVAVIRNTNFSKDCQLNLDKVAFIDVEVKQFASKKLKFGDIIIEKSGGSEKQPVGRPILFNISDGNYSFSNFTSTLRIKDNTEVNSAYLHKCLYAFYLKGETIKLQSKTTGLHNLNIKGYLRLNIPLPPLSTQLAIVSELDKINKLIRLKKEQLKDFDNLAQSLFYEMFGDSVENEKGWEVKKLREIALEKMSYGSGASAVPYNQKIRYIRITDIDELGCLKKDIVSPNICEDKYLLSDGDILFARSGATVGKTFLFKSTYGSCIYAGYLIRLRPNTQIVIPEYVYHYTKTHYYRSFIESNQRVVAQPNINAQQYSSLKLPLPPLPLQQQFAARIEAIERQKQQVSETIKDLETLLASRMQYWFD